jgi:hypothetical protein
MGRLILSALLMAVFISIPHVGEAQSTGAPAEISADLGSCSALITVTEADAKPVYGAKVSARVQYGVMGVKKLDLEAYTGADGKLKVDRLPESLKKPLTIHIEKDGKGNQVEFNPGLRCHATFEVQFH